ncbi:ion transporter [Kytococcus sedentarius]|uniref:ion transporter n=1 Tax=Kytococcus sedentarius TaxID=1276 RepID=UPI000660F9E3|nr:ion transporter [Kytococcus sedentarius]
MRERLYSLVNGDEGEAMWCGRVMTVLIVASLVPLCFKDSNPALEAIEYACVVVFILDYLARWVTADLKLGKGALSFVIYPFTPMAIIDLLSILPVFLALNDALRTLRVLRLFRAARAFKLIRYSRSASAISAVFEKQRQALLAVLCFAIAYILVSALVVFNVEPDTFRTFFDAVYWAVVSLTTVGYGDLYPSTDVGRTIAMISSLMGVAVVALPSGIITAGMLDELRRDDDASNT